MYSEYSIIGNFELPRGARFGVMVRMISKSGQLVGLVLALGVLNRLF